MTHLIMFFLFVSACITQRNAANVHESIRRFSTFRYWYITFHSGIKWKFRPPCPDNACHMHVMHTHLHSWVRRRSNIMKRQTDS